MQEHTPAIHVRLASSPQDILKAQHLRYKIFYEERGAQACATMAAAQRDIEPFDEHMDHLLVIDSAANDAVVGTYRLLRCDIAKRLGRFYTEQEFNVGPLISSGARLLELGRSCVLPAYRNKAVMQMLWRGIASYVADHRIDIMFGCASFHGTDLEPLKEQLSYLYHYHMSDDHLRARVQDSSYISMNMMDKDSIDVRRAFMSLEPLIKGYLRVGARVGDGVFVDHQFNTSDVCIIMPTRLVTQKYLRHYSRETGKDIVAGLTDSLQGAAAE